MEPRALWVRFGSSERPVRTIAELNAAITEARGGAGVDFWLFEKLEVKGGLDAFVYRAVGLKQPETGASAYVLSNGQVATLVFLDEDMNERVVVSQSAHPLAAAPVRFELETGETVTTYPKHLLSVDMAFDGLRQFFVHRVPPDSMTYESRA